MVPTSLPELPKPSRTPGKSQKSVLWNPEFHRKNKKLGILTWIDEFRPGNKTIYVVLDEESTFSGPRSPNLSPDQVFEENVPYKKLCFNMCLLLISCFLSVHRDISIGDFI